MLKEVLERGRWTPTRAKLLSTGKHVDAQSLFGYQARFDLAKGFPLVTTKRMSFGTIVIELLWFLRGDTNVRWLQERKVTIWDEWADAEGELGPVYGKQWRRWEGPDGAVIDQIARVLEGIKEVQADPRASVGRRLIVSAWNPADVPKMALPPCHTLFQFYVQDNELSCHLYQRSADAFLGVPFNIASYALLTHLVAHVSGLKPRELVISYGDLHAYSNHLEAAREQCARNPLPKPRLTILPEVTSLDAVLPQHIQLDGYRHLAALPGEVAV